MFDIADEDRWRVALSRQVGQVNQRLVHALNQMKLRVAPQDGSTADVEQSTPAARQSSTQRRSVADNPQRLSETIKGVPDAIEEMPEEAFESFKSATRSAKQGSPVQGQPTVPPEPTQVLAQRSGEPPMDLDSMQLRDLRLGNVQQQQQQLHA